MSLFMPKCKENGDQEIGIRNTAILSLLVISMILFLIIGSFHKIEKNAPSEIEVSSYRQSGSDSPGSLKRKENPSESHLIQPAKYAAIIKNLSLGATQLTRDEFLITWKQIASEDGLESIVPRLMEEDNPWLVSLGCLAVLELGEEQITDEFPLLLDGSPADLKAPELYAFSALLDLLWRRENFESWNSLRYIQVQNLNEETSSSIIQIWINNQLQLPASFYILGTDSLSVKRTITWLAEKSEEFRNVMTDTLSEGVLSKHWQIEFLEVLYSAGFPGGVDLYRNILPESENMNSNPVAIGLISEFEGSTEAWRQKNQLNQVGYKAYEMASWLYRHPFVTPGSGELLEIKNALKKREMDTTKQLYLTHINFLIQHKTDSDL